MTKIIIFYYKLIFLIFYFKIKLGLFDDAKLKIIEPKIYLGTDTRNDYTGDYLKFDKYFHIYKIIKNKIKNNLI